MAVAVPKRTDLPGRDPSPKKSPGPKTATTASLPVSFTTERRTPPFWMYSTSLQTSPCEKIVSFFWNSATFLATPEDSRKFWALNVFWETETLPLDFLLLAAVGRCALLGTAVSPSRFGYRSTGTSTIKIRVVCINEQKWSLGFSKM